MSGYKTEKVLEENTISEVVICKECSGTGEITNNLELYHDITKNEYIYKKCTCPACRGDRVLLKQNIERLSRLERINR